LEGRQKIASLQKDNESMWNEVCKLRNENASLQAEVRRLRERIWYPIRNARQLRAALRKIVDDEETTNG
jgi:regulator of replication initiation timing